jgi:hypothetical protein
MKKPRGGKSRATLPLIWKYRRSAVNIAVSRRYPLFYVAVIQNSPLNMPSQMQALTVERLYLTLKRQSGKKTNMGKLNYPRSRGSMFHNFRSLKFFLTSRYNI